GNKSKLVLNGKRREVLQMIDQGMSNDEIADKLKIGKGEIGLIRGLSK
ncbi:MAG: response regulator containing a CheY-like receiver domain and an DNA-binding domain, partial [Clostridiaceae bacterium]|nr:response regulator containing a CheY-like receiver domain and an DNA-binding domain [Clostridiaceae bacterium]